GECSPGALSSTPKPEPWWRIGAATCSLRGGFCRGRHQRSGALGWLRSFDGTFVGQRAGGWDVAAGHASATTGRGPWIIHHRGRLFAGVSVLNAVPGGPHVSRSIRDLRVGR